MRRARDPEHPLRQQRDPYDLEANYQRPIARGDVIRVAVKAALVVAAGVWFKFASDDRLSEGAELALAAGTTLVGAALTDLIYLRSREIEQVFFRNRSQQLIARWLLLAAGLVLSVTGLLAYAA